jgi:hypothetical protein
MHATFQSVWMRKLIGKLGVPYNRRLRVRGSPHPHDYGALLPPLAAESNDFPVMSDESGAFQFLSSLSVPKEPSKIARHFNAGTGWENPESRRDG